MKFVCDNCKAKYQIGDDKVAGKTLRMKCRRCGHLIQVAASVTESSVSTKLPTDSATGSFAVPQSALSQTAAVTAADLVTGSTSALFPAPSAPPGAPPPRPSAAMRPLEDPNESSPEDGATMVRPSPLFLFQDQKPATPPPAGARSLSAPTPRPPPATPSALGSVPPRPATSNPGFGPRLVPPARASMRQSSIPPPNHSSTGAVPRAPLRSAPGAAVALAQSAEHQQAPRITPEPAQNVPPQHAVSSPGLYGGFAQAVSNSREGGPISTSQLPTEDWYVGIAGVPLGPVRLSVLREKASQNQVSADSLVWREGFDEWQPVKKVPGLLEIVEEAKVQRSSRNSGLTPVPGPAPSYSGSPSPSAPAAPRPSMQSSATILMPDPAPSHPFDLVPSTPPPNASSPGASTQAARPSDDLFGPPAAKVDVVKDPFASTGASPVAAASVAAPAPSGFGLSTTAAFAGDKPASDVERPSVAPESLAPKKKKGMHPMVWAFIAMAAAFGGVAAWALFLRKPDVVYLPGGGTVEANNNAAPPAPPPTTKSTEDPSSPDSTATADATTSSSGPVATWSGKLPPNASAPKGSGSSTFDPSGFGPTPPGPKTGPTNDTSGGGGGALTEGQASGVVSRNSPRVRRTCWDPQVSARSADAPSSVKVTATVNVAPNGSVTSVSTSGGNEKHYPGLAGCVAATVKGWSFPTSGEGGKVVVPFSFNAQ